MSDVEKTLREIRERVRVQMRMQIPGPDSKSAEPRQQYEATLESLKANLSVIERSRNRLPPLTSYRRGWVADLELWCKRLLKRASHWFTWEQVNFNSAASSFLEDVLVVLSAHEDALSRLKEQLEKVTAAAEQLRVDERAPSERSAAARIIENRNISIADRYRLIDSEIYSLARRIEELRARKAPRD